MTRRKNEDELLSGGANALARRFERYAVRTSGCTLWTGSRNNKGRPFLSSIEGRGSQHKLASHVAWYLAFEEWPKQLNHSCNNGDNCVAITHMYEGTQVENMADLAAKETCANGHLWSECAQVRPNGTRYCKRCANTKRQERRR